MIAINKLGSSSSKVIFNDMKVLKVHSIFSEEEFYAVEKGMELLSKNNPKTIHLPEYIEKRNSEDNTDGLEIYYEQTKLEPWIKHFWITGEQLYSLGKTILEQQEILIKNGFCFVDARPENYWLAEKNGKLVDLGSIKPLTSQNLLSFETDFQNHILNPLMLEKELNIPISSFFKGELQKNDINPWGLTGNIKSFKRFRNSFKQTIVKYISNKISSSSPEFVNFLNSEWDLGDNNSNQKIKENEIKNFFKNKMKLMKKFQPIPSLKSDWINYNKFHSEIYFKKKVFETKEFVSKIGSNTKIVDLGANLTNKEIGDIDIFIDNDMSICREMRSSYSDDKIILQIDIANALCSSENIDFFALNCFGKARAAVIAGLIHHLIIDCGLNINAFYKNLSILFENVLLEFPNENDPMVNLLIRKKNENIFWSWEKQHSNICYQWFDLIKKSNLSDSRFMLELKSKHNEN